MGLLINGKWFASPDVTEEVKLLQRRDAETLRHWITPDDNGPTSDTDFTAEADRYHLYVSLACPFAHRVIIMRHLKGLQDIISMSEVDPLQQDEGWEFSKEYPDPLYTKNRLYEIYARSNAAITSRVSVPVLWDKKNQTIVSTDSGDIMRILNSAFNRLSGNKDDYYPPHLHEAINTLNDWLFNNINVGVYRAGFATNQQIYEQQANTVFEALAALEARLGEQRFLHGPSITESDWRLFTTLIRFDAVYHPLFKLNLLRLTDFSNLSAYVRNLYQQGRVAETVNLQRNKYHYFASFTSINPSGLVPVGGETDFSAPHYRAAPFATNKLAC
ncbi:MAG: glutathione S-transferase C-terminal domain-containing protein [Pseudomonadales bacterium]|nr:glutathione S-transferase C-terminal domain-containing protein [Pseudomonadales bacterium]